MRKLKIILAIVSLLPVVMLATARPQVQQSGKQPIYTITINVVARTTKAVNYQHRNGSTTIGFQGTPLMPAARGEAKVESKQGYMEVEVEFDNLQSATRFGPEFLTYVLWAITPEGRATNMGEIILNGTKSKLDVTTELQSFGLIVTAEPYFAVSQPSDAVVMENVVRKDTVGKVEEVDAKYELLQRGQYVVNVLPADLKPIQLDKGTPLDLYEARNAVRIAKWAGADVSAAESFEKASKLLDQAEAYKARKAGSRPIAMTAREAVQTAEDARLITLKNQADARLAQERAASADREAAADAAAAVARANANDAERDRFAADARAEGIKLDAQLAALRASGEAKAVAERTRLDAEHAAQRAASDKEAAEKANQQAKKADAEQSEREKQELRNKIAGQLNSILQTKDSARGLIVNMSDVLFDTGQYSLKPGAREKLAKISGIVLAYPTLALEVEGHTDSVGSDDLNFRLSENRADSVRDFLVGQGILRSSVGAHGYGESQPISTNDTAVGRQQNRRVELIVSGDVIASSTAGAVQAKPPQ
jgi:outer membrane protein OmpA-like peptidoglycan-associated protein